MQQPHLWNELQAWTTVEGSGPEDGQSSPNFRALEKALLSQVEAPGAWISSCVSKTSWLVVYMWTHAWGHRSSKMQDIGCKAVVGLSSHVNAQICITVEGWKSAQDQERFQIGPACNPLYLPPQCSSSKWKISHSCNCTHYAALCNYPGGKIPEPMPGGSKGKIYYWKMNLEEVINKPHGKDAI